MASEIRVDKINSLSGVGTVTLSPTGVDIAGITTVATFKVGTGVTASSDGDIFATGVCTATTFSGAVSGTTGTFTGDVTVSSANLTLGDSSGSNNIIVLGASNDLQISHVSNVSKIRGVTTNDIHIESAADFKIKHTDTDGSNAEDMIVCTGDGAVDLYNDNTKRFATTGNGADVFGSGASSAYLKLINTSASSNNSHQFTIDGYNSANTYWNKIKIDGSEVHLNTYTGNRATLTNTALTFASGVNISMANGNGIDFSATADSSGSMSNELFDDYEEGTFTPYIDREHGTPNVGYAAQDGYYTKIGRVVYFYAEVRINSYDGNGSYGNTFLRGLPFQSAARTGNRGAWDTVIYHSYYRDMTTTDGERDIAVVQHSSEQVVFYIQRNENSWATPPAPDANDQFKIGGFYFA